MGSYDCTIDAYVISCWLPSAVKALCTMDRETGGNLILVNEALSDKAKVAACNHEICHLRQGDLSAMDTSVATLEEINADALK